MVAVVALVSDCCQRNSIGIGRTESTHRRWANGMHLRRDSNLKKLGENVPIGGVYVGEKGRLKINR